MNHKRNALLHRVRPLLFCLASTVSSDVAFSLDRQQVPILKQKTLEQLPPLGPGARMGAVGVVWFFFLISAAGAVQGWM